MYDTFCAGTCVWYCVPVLDSLCPLWQRVGLACPPPPLPRRRGLQPRISQQCGSSHRRGQPPQHINRFCMAGAYIILIRELCTELVRLFSLPGENPGDDIHIVSLLLAAVQERCYHKVISPNEDDIISKNIKYICRGSANTIFKWE